MKERGFVRMVLVLLAVLITVFIVGYSLIVLDGGREALYQPEYMDKLFVDGKVVHFDITMDAAELENMLANAMQEEFHSAAVTVDGMLVGNVAIRTKGNSSLFSIAGARSGSSSSRFSFKLDFDKYLKSQSLWGLKKLNLNNCWSDPTFMREYITYETMSKMGLKTPGQVFVSLSLNGKEWGLYLGVEAIEEDFLARYFQNAKGDLYKPEGTGSDLKWISDDASDYTGMNLKTNQSNQDDGSLIALVSALNGKGGQISDVLDIDSTLRYLAVSTALGNFDSYQGQMKHNYYLYEEDGYFTIIGWDYNMSFGGFAYMRTESGASVAIDEPVQGALTDRPLIAALLSVEEYKQKYYVYLREVVEKYLSAEYMQAKVDELTSLIKPFIPLGDEGEAKLAEFNASFSISSGRTPGLLQFASEMSSNILAQLDGTLPKTADELGLASTGFAGGVGGIPQGRMPAMGAALPEGAIPPENSGFSPPGGASNDLRSTMRLIDDVIQNGLTDENRQGLLSLGMSEEQIEQVANGQMPEGFMLGPPGLDRPGAMGGFVPPGNIQPPLPVTEAISDIGTAAAEETKDVSGTETQIAEADATVLPAADKWSVREDFARPLGQSVEPKPPISKAGLIAAATLIIALPGAIILSGRVRMRRLKV